jgi:hypothetical protein
MKKNRNRHRVWLGLMLAAALMASGSPARAQSGFLSDWTWGYFGATREESRLGREDIIAREGYCPTGGCVLRLDRVEIRPNRVRKGGTVRLATTYTILTPEHIAIPVSITREIFYLGKSLGQTKSMESRVYNGTRIQQVDFTLPGNAAPGIYQLITKISTGYGTAQDRTDFQVD